MEERGPQIWVQDSNVRLSSLGGFCPLSTLCSTPSDTKLRRRKGGTTKKKKKIAVSSLPRRGGVPTVQTERADAGDREEIPREQTRLERVADSEKVLRCQVEK